MSEFVFAHLVYCCISSLLVVLFKCLINLTTPDFVEVSARARLPGKYRVCWQDTSQILGPLYNRPFGIQAPKLETRIQLEFPIPDRLASGDSVGHYYALVPYPGPLYLRKNATGAIRLSTTALSVYTLTLELR